MRGQRKAGRSLWANLASVEENPEEEESGREREQQAAGPLESLGQAGGQLKDICSPVEKSATGQTREAPVAPSPCPPTPHLVIG